ncbi:MAG: S8 family serine peptidase [Chitinophagales bacterium]
MRHLLLFFLVAISFPAFSQHTYVVYLKDKKQSSYSITHAGEFLSARALLRRQLQGIPIDESDLPVSTAYSKQLLQLPVTQKFALKWENAIVLETSVDLLVQLRQLPFVRSVRTISKPSPESGIRKFDMENKQLRSCDTEVPDGFYGTAENQNRMLNLQELHRRGFWGNDVLISVMDVGFTAANSNLFFDSVYKTNRVLYTYDFVDHENDVYNNAPHGLNAWSCIAANIPYKMVGTAPQAKFLLFVTEDDNSETVLEEYNWAKAAEVADSIGADVFSTSLGYTTFDATDSVDSHTYADLDGHTTVITKAANHAASKGILVCNSAGNEGQKPWYYIAAPADGDSVIAVGAVNNLGDYAAFSSHGPNATGKLKPNVCAQGAGTAVVQVGGILGTSNGTSFSCPVMAGAIACLRQAFPNKTNAEIQNAVEQSANFASNPNNEYGYGIPDFEIAYLMLSKPEWFSPKLDLNFVKVVPNPFCDYLEVYLGRDAEKGLHLLHVYDLQGREVLLKSFFHEDAAFEMVKFSGADELASGNYLIRLDTGGTHFFQKQ